jgi:hypothetical protein
MTAGTVQRNRPQLLTAEDVSNEIDRINAHADAVGEALDLADEDATNLKIEFDNAYAGAFIDAVGSVDMRKYIATRKTIALRKEWEHAELQRKLKRRLDRIMRLGFEGARTKAASHRAETASFGPGSTR